MCVTRHQNDAINLRLALLGLPLPVGAGDSEAAQLAQPILARQRELSRRLADRLCAADGRIQAFLDDYLADTGERPEAATAHVRARRARAGPRAVPALRRRHLHLTPAHQLPAGQRRAPQPGQRPPDHRGGVPHRRGRPADPRRQDRRAEGGLRPTAGARVRAAAGGHGPALHGQPAGAGRVLRVPAAASRWSPRRCPAPSGEADGDPVHRARRPGQQPRLRRGDLRQRRRPVPAGERRLPGARDLDRTHRLRHPRPAPDPRDEEGARPAPRRRRHRPPAARRHLLGRRGRALQQRSGLQDLRAATRAA